MALVREQVDDPTLPQQGRVTHVADGCRSRARRRVPQAEERRLREHYYGALED